MLKIKHQIAKLPLPFWISFYIFLLLIIIPVLVYIGTFNKAAPGNLSVTIDQKSGTNDPNPSYTSVFTVQFSEAIDKATFTNPDITLAGTAPGQAIQSITEAGSFNQTTYEVRIQATSAGTITPSIAQELITAQANPTNTNNASTSTDNLVTYDGSYLPNEFIMRIKTDNPGVSYSNQYTILINGSYNHSYSVDCNNDGTNEHINQIGNVTCTYGTPGEYDIAITGTFPHMRNASNGDKEKIIDVKQWGDIQWLDMSYMFDDASNMTMSATDAPDLSQVTNMTGMFYNATSFNTDINHWNTSNVTNMSHMFYRASSFNSNISSWDTSNVTEMETMFDSTSSFNQPINDWDISNVTNVSGMFSYATSFNQPLNNWNVGNVTDMNNMFVGAASFNQPLNNWSTGSVTFMIGMFYDASSFNQPLNNWNTSSVTNMSGMFAGAQSFNQPLNNWNVGNVTDMNNMFVGAASFNQPLNNWNTSSVTNMDSMFIYAASFDQPINDWDISNVTNARAMFAGAISFNQPLNNWNTSNITNMFGMFAGAQSFNQSLASWDVSNVTDMTYMFGDADGNFSVGSGLSTTNYDATLTAWSQQNLEGWVTFDAGTSKYCASEAARQSIIDTKSWTINDSGKDCTVALGIPQNLSGEPHPTSIDVDWDDVVGADRYRLEYKLTSDSTWTEDTYNTINGSYLTISNLDLETSYDFRVKAVDSINNESDWSNTLTISTLAQQTYHITNCQQLQAIAINPVTFEFGDTNGNYILDNDIDCSETTVWTWEGLLPPAYEGGPVGFFGIMDFNGEHFTGNFDGQGHTIRGIYQNIDVATPGLFTFASGSEIKDVTLEGMAINQIGSNTNGVMNTYGVASLVAAGSDLRIVNAHTNSVNINILNRSLSTAGLVGLDMGLSNYNQEYGNKIHIENSSAEGSIVINQEPEITTFSSYMQRAVGGLFGGAHLFMDDPTHASVSTHISNSYANMDITYNLSDTDQQEVFAGGLAGILVQANIANSYASGSLSLEGRGASGKFFTVGGLVGFLTGAVSDSYSSGAVSVNNYTVNGSLNDLYASFIGGLVGWWYGFNDRHEPVNITNTFSAASININNVNVPGEGMLLSNALVGFAPEGESSGVVLNSFFDQSKTGQDQCVEGYYGTPPDLRGYTGSTQSPTICHPVNTDGSDPNYFINNKINPPLNQWDFTNIWRTNYNNYPDFVGSTAPTTPPDPNPNPNPNPDPTTPPTNPTIPPSPTTPTTPTTPTNPPKTTPTTNTTTNTPEPSTPAYTSPANKPAPATIKPLAQNQVVKGAFMASVVNYASRLPKPVAKAMPYSLLALLLALSGLYGYSSHMENQRRKNIQALINRFKALLTARATYLRITSHYISTPITKMQGVIELLASGITSTSSSTSGGSGSSSSSSSSSTASASSQAIANPETNTTPQAGSIISPTSPNPPSSNPGSTNSQPAPPPVAMAVTTTTLTIPENAIVAARSGLKSLADHASELLSEGQSLTGRQQANIKNLEKKKGLSFLTHPAFWLPVVIISTIVSLLNVIFIQADRYAPTAITIFSQALLGFVGIIALGVSYYFLQQHKAQRQLLVTEQDIEQEFNNRQTSFIADATSKLSDDLLILEGVNKDITKYPKVAGFTNGLAELKQIVNQLEKLSKLSKHVPGLTWSTDLSRTIAHATQDLQALAEQHNVTITSTNLQPATMVAIEPEALNHLITAPLKNAIDASTAGKQIELNQSYNQKDQQHPVTITITDHGKGIPADQLANIFTPFNSAHSLERFSDTGLGLDLYLCKVITTQYNATIDITSQEGEGATTTIGFGDAKG